MVTLDSRDFRAPLSKPLKTITAVVVVVAMAVPLLALLPGGEEDRAVLFVVVAILPAALFITALFRPVGYRLSDIGVAVLRPVGALVLPYEAIADVQRGKNWLRLGTIGLFRSGGFFGVYGIFRCSDVGVFNAYLTDPDLSVMIRASKGRSLMVSPHDPEMFISQLRDRMSATAGYANRADL